MRRMNGYMIMIFGSIAFVSGCGGGGAENFSKLGEANFSIIDCPAISNETNTTQVEERVFDNQDAFAEAYANASTLPVVNGPTIDFSELAVVGIQLGIKPTLGYSVEVTSVQESDRDFLVSYEIVEPTPGCEVDTATSHPYCFIAIEKPVS